MSENWAKIDRVNFSIVIISPFWVHIPTSCKGVGFGTESARAETDNKIELRKCYISFSLSSFTDYPDVPIPLPMLLHFLLIILPHVTLSAFILISGFKCFF